MRELKQNPHAVVTQVLAADEPFRLVSRGYDTGVVMQPATAQSNPQRFVSGAALNAMRNLAPLTAEQRQAWKDDIATAIGEDDVEDPWRHR